MSSEIRKFIDEQAQTSAEGHLQTILNDVLKACSCGTTGRRDPCAPRSRSSPDRVCERPWVSFQTNQVSTVPNNNSPFSARKIGRASCRERV